MTSMMSRQVWRVVMIVVALVLGAALAGSGALRIAGVNPNLLLVCLVLIAYSTRNPVFFVAIALCTLALARSTPQFFDAGAAALATTGVSIFFVVRRIFWEGAAGIALALSMGTVLLYLMLEPGYLIAAPLAVLGELAYNLCVGLLVYTLLLKNMTHHA